MDSLWDAYVTWQNQLNISKSGIKNGTEITLNIPLNVIGDSNDEINFPDKLSLTDIEVSNNSSGNIK